MKQILDAHLRAAEEQGRTLTAEEASLIDALVTTPQPPQVEATTAHIPTPGVPQEQSDGIVPSKADLQRLVAAAQERQPLSVRAAFAHYATHATGAPTQPTNLRLADFLVQRGAAQVGVARSIDVPRIASGDAGEWTTGNKAEIVTALSATPSKVFAAFTDIESMAYSDVSGLEVLIGALLGRRVMAKENAGLASQIAAGGSAGGNDADAVKAIVGAIVAAANGGTNPNVLLLSPAAAAGALSAAQIGMGADQGWQTQTLFGLEYLIVPGLTGADAVAADARALAVARSEVMVLVDPYTAAKTNGVTLRVETSAAAVVLDANAVGHTTIGGARAAK